MTTLSASVPAHRAIADYLEHGGYDRFLRKLRRDLAAQQAEHAERHRPVFSRAKHSDAARRRYFT
jgi:DNA-binding transcriptional MocR family regulator